MVGSLSHNTYKLWGIGNGQWAMGIGMYGCWFHFCWEEGRSKLSRADQIAALKLILEKPQNISIFMSLDDDIKKVFVEQLLSDNA
ncbi:hypothetical protein L3X38_020703 [Prunus dulcis]|uniref:Uncharacterized protein n=1 Tax=Prunus dulcis TaxID=3755 RepID=A0AAD4WDK6_PRUDU|nr:hypothetical protein L3X38_020703 [Prunus dulcis]